MSPSVCTSSTAVSTPASVPSGLLRRSVRWLRPLLLTVALAPAAIGAMPATPSVTSAASAARPAPAVAMFFGPDCSGVLAPC